MKQIKKRGFTLVELVIVIAVIAILAAVLIPTFITVIDNANNSADVQLVRNMNSVFVTDIDADSTATAENLRKLLKDNGITEFETKKSDNVILYDKAAKKLVLADLDDIYKDLNVAGAISTAGMTAYAAGEKFTLNKNAYSFEDIFTGYVVVSTGGNPLTKALHDLHNLPSNQLTEENTNTIITNAFASIDNVAIKDTLKGIINTTCIVAKTGFLLNAFMGTENVRNGYTGEADSYKMINRDQMNTNTNDQGPIRTKVIFHEELSTVDLTRFPPTYACGALTIILPQTIQSVTMEANPTRDMSTVVFMGNTSIITAEQKQTLIEKGAQFSESPLPLAELKEQLTEKGPLIAQSEFYVAQEANAEEWKYTDLEKALADAKESASLSGLNRTVVVTKNVEIAQGSAIEIPAGVTLLLPYDVAPTDGKYQENATVTDRTSSFGTDGKKSVELTVKGTLTIAKGGKLVVGGETTGQQGGQSGCTAGRYAQITLDAGAKIESYGDVNSYGFIVEAASVGENHPQVIMHSGAMKLPFIVVEHRGGSQFLFMADDGWEAAKEAGKPETKDENGDPKNLNVSETVKYFLTSPFNRFYMENVRVPLTVEYGAQLLGYADLAAGDGEGGAVTDHTTDIKLVGSSSDALIELKQNTKLIAKYDTVNKVTNVEIKGSAKMNSLTMSVVVATVTTEEVFFPLSWYWNVKLSPFEDGTAATVDTTAQKIKLLPGAKLTVSKGVTLKASEIVVYDENAISDITDPANSSKTSYEKSNESATLIVNGTLEANALGGKVQTDGSGAKLTVKTASITTKELQKNAVKQVTQEQEMEGGGTETVVVTPYEASKYKDITTKLTGKTAAGDNQELTAGTYVAKDGKWEQESE